MKLVGKKIVRKNSQEINSNSEIIVNPVNGSMKLSRKLMETLNLEGKAIGFAYPEEGESGVYMYLDEDGIKMNEAGTFSNRYHSRTLDNELNNSAEEKFKVNVDTDGVEFEGHDGMTFWLLSTIESVELEAAKEDQVEEPELETEEA
jgi:hypothetical protein